MKTKEQEKLIKLSPQMRNTAQLKKLVAEAAQRDFQSYLQGCIDALGLTGNYNLDTNQWTFVLLPDEKSVSTEETT